MDYPVAEVGSKDVSVDMLVCAINPADINQIQGTCMVMHVSAIIQIVVSIVWCSLIHVAHDDSTLLGVYGTTPPLPAVGGGEGVGVVTSVGAEVTTLSKGDWVVLSKPGLGEPNVPFSER